MIAFEEMQTEEERKNQLAFEAAQLDQTEVGEAARAECTRSYYEHFELSNTTCDGRLDREQFRKFFELTEKAAMRKGLKGRGMSEEYADMFYQSFNEYNPAIEGVSDDELRFCLDFCSNFTLKVVSQESQL